MNTVPNRDYLDALGPPHHTLHHHSQHAISQMQQPPPPSAMSQQHQPYCKQQCFVFTEIADIELPPEITKFGVSPNCGGSGLSLDASGCEKMKNGGISMAAYHKKESACGMGEESEQRQGSSKGRKLLIVLGVVLLCIAMAGGIPIALQLRSSSLLEARLAFVRRLLTESPLIEGTAWAPPTPSTLEVSQDLGINYTSTMGEVRQNHIGAVMWPIAVPCGAQYLDAVQLALEGIDEAKRITASTDAMHIVESADEMEQTHIRGEVAVLMGLGGGHALGASLAVLRSMYMLGVRFVSITSKECTTPWAAAAIRSRDYLVEENATNSLNEFGKVLLNHQFI